MSRDGGNKTQRQLGNAPTTWGRQYATCSAKYGCKRTNTRKN